VRDWRTGSALGSVVGEDIVAVAGSVVAAVVMLWFAC
jgi:hypothetical protein